MNLTVTGRNLEITDAINNFIKKRLAKAGDRLYEKANIHFSFYVDKNRHMAEATVKQKGLTTRAKDETRDLYLTVNNVLVKIEKQLRKHKNRVQSLPTNKA